MENNREYISKKQENKLIKETRRNLFYFMIFSFSEISKKEKLI